jgi:hypothetical protein
MIKVYLMSQYDNGKLIFCFLYRKNRFFVIQPSIISALDYAPPEENNPITIPWGRPLDICTVSRNYIVLNQKRDMASLYIFWADVSVYLMLKPHTFDIVYTSTANPALNWERFYVPFVRF